jgi:DNA-binding Lrp family transcriptional regulator
MDNTDKQILNMIQTGFPVVAEPYVVIGRSVGISEEEAYQRVMELMESGIIRRLGASFDSRGLGWTSTLCTMCIPPEKIEKCASVVSEHPGVTHNYERDHKFNLWFTYIAPDKDTVSKTLKEIESKTGYKVYNLPMIKKFKIKVDFQFD